MAEQWSELRSITSAMLLTKFAVERGALAPRLLRGTQIKAGALNDPTAEITARQELTLMRNIVDELGDEPGLGLLAGERYHATTHGVWGFAVISSPDVRSALDIGMRYADLAFSFSRLYLDHDGPHPRIVFDDSNVPVEVRRFHFERDFAATLTIARDLIPLQLPTRSIEIPFAEHPVYAAFAAAIPDALVTYDAPIAVLTLDASGMTLPVPQANPHTATLYERQCFDLVQRRRERLGVSGQVRNLLIRRGGMAAQPDIAADLNISVRTLRRRLADENTTFRELSDETFGVLSEELLGAGLTVDQVASRLGYSSPSAFTHAFKAWKGETPGRYARARRLASTHRRQRPRAILGWNRPAAGGRLVVSVAAVAITVRTPRREGCCGATSIARPRVSPLLHRDDRDDQGRDRVCPRPAE